MNGYQIVVVAFGIAVAALSIAGVVAVCRSLLRYRALWIIGCLFGFVGIGINWTSPNDLVLLFGVNVPVISVFKILPAGPIIVKTFFPFVAIIALVKTRTTPR